MEDLNKCTVCGSDAKYEDGFSPLESVYYAYCSNSECIFHLIENNYFSRSEWNYVNKPDLTPMQKAAPEMYEMLKLFADNSVVFPLNMRNDMHALLAKARGEQ